MSNRKAQKINKHFFCDGAFYLLTSSSLGGSLLTPEAVSTELLQQPEGVTELLSQGIALPLFFPGDCALDKSTRFVLGDLTEAEAQNWIGKITAWLKVPCGRIILVAGGGDPSDLAAAIAAKPQDQHYVCYDSFEIPAGDYQVDVYCYINSMNFAVEFDEELAETFHLDVAEIANRAKYYRDHFQAIGEGYIIRFSPLTEPPQLPEQVDEIGWCGVFKYR